MSFISVKMALDGKRYVGTKRIGFRTISLETVSAGKASEPPELAADRSYAYRPHIKIICGVFKTVNP